MSIKETEGNFALDGSYVCIYFQTYWVIDITYAQLFTCQSYLNKVGGSISVMESCQKHGVRAWYNRIPLFNWSLAAPWWQDHGEQIIRTAL